MDDLVQILINRAAYVLNIKEEDLETELISIVGAILSSRMRLISYSVVSYGYYETIKREEMKKKILFILIK